MPIPNPFRYVDRSGRNIVWVLLHEGAGWHTVRSTYESSECKIVLCPKEMQGQPQDIVTRPCHREGNSFFRLIDDMHDWLEGQVSNYQLEWRWHDGKCGWHVGFPVDEKDKAMLFKLSFAP